MTGRYQDRPVPRKEQNLGLLDKATMREFNV